MKTHPLFRTALGSVLGVAMLAAPVAATAAEGDIVLIKGISYDREMPVFKGFGASFGSREEAELRRRACSGQGREMAEASLAMLDLAWAEAFKIDEQDLPTHYTPGEQLGSEFVEFCDSPSFPPEGFVVMYSECAMYMWQDQQELLIVLPPSSRGAHMTLRAPGEDPIVADLSSASAAMDQMQPMRARLYATDVSPVEDEGVGNWLGWPTYSYTIRYEGSAGASFMPGVPPIRVNSEGGAWIAPDAPGLDVIRAFYGNFSDSVQTPGIVNGFLSGLVDQMGAIIEKGMPVHIQQTVTSATTAPMRVGTSGTSIQSITGVRVLRAANAPEELSRFCDSSIVTSGERVQDINRLRLTQGAGATSEEQDEMARAMEEAREALEALDPETRRMMEQMGIPIPGL